MTTHNRQIGLPIRSSLGRETVYDLVREVAAGWRTWPFWTVAVVEVAEDAAPRFAMEAFLARVVLELNLNVVEDPIFTSQGILAIVGDEPGDRAGQALVRFLAAVRKHIKAHDRDASFDNF